MNEQAQLAALRDLLRPRIGEFRAITIARIGYELGHTSRRQTETLLELHLGDLGFCVVSSSAGYYRHATAEQINHYRAALRSRIKCIAVRCRDVARSASAEGWPRAMNGRDFTQFKQPTLL